MKKILMTAALLACIFGCGGSDGNGPVNLPPAQKPDPENPGPLSFPDLG